MRRAIELGLDEVMPTRAAVFAHQGIPPDAEVSERIAALYEGAAATFAACAQPHGLIGEIDASAFAELFAANGESPPDAVVRLLIPAADHLALYAATIGAAVSERITELFADKHFAPGSMLDSVASMAAERAAEALAARWRADLRAGELADDAVVLGYSPGYCGWHITGQRRLFAHLEPAAIGISLNDSCMMSPLKSVSGVLVAAPPAAHVFTPRFSYCPDCRQRSCIGRMQPLREALRSA